MRSFWLLGVSMLAAMAGTALAADSAASPAAEPTSAEYMITGLHCPMCSSTIEESLKKVKGVQEVKVDFQAKNAHVKFDERQMSAQQLAQAIANTPHMMGSGMHYGGMLVLRVPDVNDAASAAKAQSALSKVPGVAQATANPEQHTVVVQFAAQGKTTSQQLMDALREGGLNAAAPSHSAKAESHAAGMTDVQQKNLAKLSPDDQQAAAKQGVCPISGDPLGAMGMPVKIELDGHTVFLCCEDCRADAMKKKDEVLKKLGFEK